MHEQQRTDTKTPGPILEGTSTRRRSTSMSIAEPPKLSQLTISRYKGVHRILEPLQARLQYRRADREPATGWDRLVIYK